ncbi:MAG: peroxiredoxin [Nakamurella sp.]
MAESTVLRVGDPAPHFRLPSAAGPLVALADHRGRRPVLLVFYPFAFSPICTSELDSMRDHAFERVQLIAVSCDPKYALKVFARERGYRFPLLSDFWPHGEVARAFGVFDEPHGMPVRGTFLIDAAGIIRFTEVNDVGDPRDQAGWRAAIAGLGAVTG